MARAKKKENLTPEERLQAALVPESEQPYKVPTNWCWVRLLDSFYNCTDSKKKIPQKEYIQDGDIAIIDQGQDLVGGYTNDSEMAFSGQLPVIIFGDHTRCIKYIDFPFVQGADGVKVLKPKQFFNTKAFYYAFQNVNIPNMGYRRHFPLFDQYAIPLPPLAEQQRIVDRIESLFAKLDEAKQKVQEALDSFETRKAAILHKAFIGELTARWRKENGVGMESWRTVTFKDACLKITDGTHHSPVNTPTGEYMYVTAKNIKEIGIDLTNITFVSKEVHDEIYSRCDVQYGDVLYIKDGATTGIATVNTIEEPFSLLSSVAVLRPDKKQIMAKYMVYNLNSSKTKAMMINNMSGNAITRLTLSKIKTAPITVCSLDEQAEIVRILDHLLAKEQQAKESTERVLEQIDLIKKSILARAFRGELGTNDPSEESAVELVRQVLQEN
ncbi:restriction endonuclease subunit S [Agathobaculum sp. Marseille-P7918]|uniref:restriction endonuclease subunit S n=1 Tax=Agathobaculum sp. Marseille-P7918 TaxID=2479843 RepID=UPI00356339DA